MGDELMKINVIENDDEKMKFEVETNLTLINLLNENIWKQKVDAAAYKKEHPYLSKPVILVRSKNPKKAVLDAADQIIEDVKDFRKQFQAATK
jgi:DNA-directed RNA polymerase subunit L